MLLLIVFKAFKAFAINMKNKKAVFVAIDKLNYRHSFIFAFYRPACSIPLKRKPK